MKRKRDDVYFESAMCTLLTSEAQGESKGGATRQVERSGAAENETLADVRGCMLMQCANGAAFHRITRALPQHRVAV